jgi:alginate O-acetyltransferase complex protein AlgJ
MKRRVALGLLGTVLVGGPAGLSLAQGAAPPVVVGKNNEWLFTPYEYADSSDAQDTEVSIRLLAEVNQRFQRHGIAVALVLVPSKIRIHADQLPPDKPLDPYTRDKYDNAVKALRAAGVNVVDLNAAFLGSAHRSSDTPLFFRLDTHWSPSGAMLAAETIRAAIDATPALKMAWSATPPVKYSSVWSQQKSVTRARDLARLMAASGRSYPPEQSLSFKVTREQESQAGLLGTGEYVGITAIGSSYTHKNALYPDALRYTLQRDLLDISLPTDQGPWFGMESYLRDEAFRTRKPKLILWEIPERELRSPPNCKYRDSRYIIDNQKWLARMRALLG